MNPIAVFDRPEQGGGRRVRGPGLQGGTVGWTERCRLSALTGRSAGKLVPLVAVPTRGFPDFNRTSGRVHEEGLDGITSQSIETWVRPQYA